MPARLLLYMLYTFIEQSNQPVTALGIAAHRPMLVPLDEWAASSAATIEIVQFPCETPRGGLLDFRKIGLAPAPKTWPKTVFGNKYLIDLMFFDAYRAKEYRPTAPPPVSERSAMCSTAPSHEAGSSCISYSELAKRAKHPVIAPRRARSNLVASRRISP